MSMTLSDLELLGAYHNAGYVDIYHEGKHTRLGTMSTDGDLVLSPEGQEFSDRQMARKYTEILTNPGDAVDLTAGASTTPITPLPVLTDVVEPPADVGDLSALDKLVAGPA